MRAAFALGGLALASAYAPSLAPSGSMLARPALSAPASGVPRFPGPRAIARLPRKNENFETGDMLASSRARWRRLSHSCPCLLPPAGRAVRSAGRVQPKMGYNLEHPKIAESITDLIGRTPLMRLNKVPPKSAKAEVRALPQGTWRQGPMPASVLTEPARILIIFTFE